ncbi:hypothetical protein V5799_005842 [Amblyomma americanum]|uniref:Secreted protein n=1 Tax=Amblyomma americanum TaxID=6943 RepID=A0AAQ4DY38_AMBAM
MHVIVFAILALQTSLVNSCTKTEKMYQCKAARLRERTCSGASPRPCKLYELKSPKWDIAERSTSVKIPAGGGNAPGESSAYKRECML